MSQVLNQDLQVATSGTIPGRTSEQIRAEIQAKFGFIPPFFGPAEQTPQVLENLWHQTLSAYVNNPLPALFKEKLSAYLSRFCVVPYCMICHSCSLRPLGMEAQEVLALLEAPPPLERDVDEHLKILMAQPDHLAVWPEPNSTFEASLLSCSIFIALERNQDTEPYRQELRRLLGPENYQYLVTFIAYIKTCHVWMEAHPDVAYEADQRVQTYFSELLQEPALANFFSNYREKVRREYQSRAEQLAELTMRRRNEAAWQQQAERERLVTEMAQRIRQSLNLDEILSTTVSEVRQFLQAERVFIFRFQGDWSGSVTVESVAPGWSSILGTKIKDSFFGQSSSRELYKRGQIQAVEDIHTAGLSKCHLDLLTRLQIKGNLVVPIVQAEQLWGLLVANHCSAPRPWQPLEIDLLKQLATQVAIAIQQSELYQQVLAELYERKQAEEKQRESEQKLKLAMQAARFGFWQLNLETGELTASNQCKANFGLPPEAEFSYSKLFECIHPDDRSYVQQRVRRALEQQTIYEAEYRSIWPDNSVHWVLARGCSIHQADGSSTRMIGITLDITERKHQEEALRQSENRLRTIIDAEPECVKLVAADGTLLDMNAAGLAMIEADSANAVVGQSIYSLIAPEYIAAFQTLIQSVCEYGSKGTLEFEIVGLKGTRRWLETHAVPLRDELDGRSMQLAITRDITERKQAEAQIREQATLLDKAQDAIFVLNLEDQILFWNESARRLYGWTASEVIAHQVDKLLFANDLSQLQAAQKGVTESGEWHGELQQVTKVGRDIIVESRWTVVRHDTEKPKSILVVNTDITEKKQLEKQFFRAQRLESIGTLAGGIAHDLNNILTPILAASQLLQRKLPAVDERSQQLLNVLESNAKRGAALVKQVLSFGRGVEGRRIVLQVKHIISEIRQVANETFPKSIDLNVNVASDLWTVSGDVTQLHQVLMNLCVNARDAMPDGGSLNITAENLFVDQTYARLHLEAKVGPYIVITVEDSGIGIPPEIIDRVFEPFFTTKALGIGTGLGLSTAIGIIKSHGGFVNVLSNVGKGTQFKVFLPAVKVTEILSVENPELPAGNRELILVVDDEAAIRETTQLSLEAHNYKVLAAKDGVEAVALYSQRKDEISAVLVDMMMPAMDGISTIQALQRLNPQVKVIAMSGLAATDKLTQAGIKTFLSKPYNAQELLQALQHVLSPVDRDCP